MKGFPTTAHVEALRKRYKKGTKIRMLAMKSLVLPIAEGTLGEVDYVDDAGEVHAKWEDGRVASFIPGEDIVEIVPKKTRQEIVTVCYGQRETWKSRKQAMASFLEAVAATEGHEQERYMNVYIDLLEGKMVCTDGDDAETE